MAAWLAYADSFAAPFLLDDEGSILENATIRRLWPLGAALHPPETGTAVSGRPLVNLSLALNYAVSGTEVWSYHAVNLIIHFLAACVLLGLVRRTLALPRVRARFGAVALPLAAAVAGLWLLHPVQTESVTYVCQRAESLAGLFYLLTFYGFVRAIDSPHPVRWRVLSFGACLLGIGTKEVMATAPLLVFLYDRTFLAGSFRRAWAERRGCHLALAATWLPLAALVASTGWTRGGTAGFGVGVAPGAYWLTQFEAVAHYLRLTVWPHPLVFDHGTYWSTWREAWPYAAGVVPVVVAVLVALWRWPAAGFPGAAFFVILAPTSLVPGTNQMIVEHRLYLPLAAALVLLVAGGYLVMGRRSWLIWPVLVLVAGWLAHLRNEAYASRLALWSDTVAKAPQNARARYNLGVAYSECGDYARAVEQTEAALHVERGDVFAGYAHVIHNKLGHDLSQLGRWPEAVVHYEQALRAKPDYVLARRNLARALVALDRPADAVPHFEALLRQPAWDAPLEAELGEALMRSNRAAEALDHLRAAVRLAPDWAPGHGNLAYALLLSGQAAEAVAHYREAVRLDHGDAAAAMGLGYALIEIGRPGEAVAPCRDAVRLQPRSAEAHNTLGIALAQSGRVVEAITAFEQSLQFAAAADVHNNLGNALAAVGRREEAMAHYREALRLDSAYAPAHRNLAQELRRAGRRAEAEEHLAAALRLEGGRASGP